MKLQWLATVMSWRAPGCFHTIVQSAASRCLTNCHCDDPLVRTLPLLSIVIAYTQSPHHGAHAVITVTFHQQAQKTNVDRETESLNP